MTEEQILKQLSEMTVTGEFTLNFWNTVVNALNTPQQTQVVINAQLIDAIQMQIGPQVAKARESLEAIKNADGVPVELEEKN
jgi:nitrogen-specific signal transduction histidine kinase